MGSGIAGISPIGYGLDAGGAFGDYSNYMPSSLGLTGMGGYGNGMAGSVFGAGGYGYGGMMGGLMEYQMYMNQLQNQIDLNNLNHVGAMHSGLINNQVNAHEESLHGMMQKLLADASVQSRLMSLYNKIREGDQRGVIEEYDKLKDRVYATFDSDISAKGISIGRADEARQMISTMYQNLISSTAPDGRTHTLKGDIDRYCDGAFMTGVISGFKGQNDRNYHAEVINHIYGERIDDVRTNQGQKVLGKGIGTIGSIFRDMIEGTALGAGTWAVGTTITAGIALLCGGKPSNWWWKATKGGAGWAAIAGIAAMGAWDIIKRIDSKTKS